ncbi:MAG: proline--tRNA ligase [Bacteroidetes bacterium]|nr:proline--tRNA ligase [Bacteroidota bacterium]
MSKGLPKREENYSEWYNQIIKKSNIAEISPVRGCMILKPYGYAIWENTKSILDKMFKDTGHENAYFPIFIPKSYFSKEAAHVEGFAKECAIVTHYRLRNQKNGKGVEVDPDSKLEEELIVRPTSETIIWDSYKRWIQSYKDLPLLINQWANVVRWEMRTRMFLRTTEILWQEGHTAHATKQEAIEETEKMLEVYANFLENYMAVPVIKGIKTENEKFAGAERTYTLETLTLDKRALQACTSHFLGTNFAKAFDVKFANKEGKLEYVWGTSWGCTTRFIGSMIMTHSDDNGLVLPPKLAPIKVVLIPIFKKEEEKQAILDRLIKIKDTLKAKGISVKLDDREYVRPGWKFSEYELKGVPIRLTLGPRDLEKNTIEIFRRDACSKKFVEIDKLNELIPNLLDEIQNNLYNKALKFRDNNIREVDSYDDFKKTLKKERGYILAHWDGTKETELKIKEETKATIRCIPNPENIENNIGNGKCIYSNKPSKGKVLFAEAY